MKKTILVISLTILMTACMPPAVVPSSPTRTPRPTSTKTNPMNTRTAKPTPKQVTLEGCVKANTSRVRSGPGTDTEILDRLRFPKCVFVIGRNTDASWVMVSYDGRSGWVYSELINVQGDTNQLNVVTGENLPVADQTIPAPSYMREEYLTDFLNMVVNDPRYDENDSVLQKYLEFISINIDRDKITYAVFGNVIENEDDFLSLSYDLILLTVLASEPGTPNDWMLERIEVVDLGPLESYAKTYVDGHENIVAIAEDRVGVLDVMELDVSYGKAQTPTKVVAKRTNTPVPEFLLCKNTGNRIGSTVTCKIPRAYCSYQSTTSGNPTFCNDAHYPNHKFTLVAWEKDWSDLDGKCIIVNGRVERYNGKPQIEAISRSQVSICQ